jgi:fatty acid desaturase
MEKQHPIPATLNILLTCLLVAISLSLFYFAHVSASWGLKSALAVIFSLLMIPVYSLLHEAMHNSFHPNRKMNDFYGNILGCLFFVPLNFIRFTHNGHHKRNRSDYEMFDLYYPHHYKFQRYVFFYSIILFYWILLPLVTLFIVLAPGLLKKRLILENISIKGMIQHLDNKFFPTMRIEGVVILIFQFFLLWLINFDYKVYFVFYAFHCFSWSSQNYVNHAFSKRDIQEGAHNHYMPIIAQKFFLNFNLHEIHHRNPTLPWNYLSQFEPRDHKGRISYFKAWLRMWKGPILTQENCPLGITKLS